MADESDTSSSETETETLSERKKLAGKKGEYVTAANSGSKDGGESAFSQRMEKAGTRESPPSDDVPSAASRSIPRSVDESEPSSLDRGGDSGSSDSTDE